MDTAIHKTRRTIPMYPSYRRTVLVLWQIVHRGELNRVSTNGWSWLMVSTVLGLSDRARLGWYLPTLSSVRCSVLNPVGWKRLEPVPVMGAAMVSGRGIWSLSCAPAEGAMYVMGQAGGEGEVL